MKKVDVIRMIASMPDETQVFFNHEGKEIAIDNAEYIKGRLVFGVAAVQSPERVAEAIESKSKKKKVLPGA